MQVFRLKSPNQMVSAVHKWQLPFAKCPKCSKAWNDIELAYPQVQLPDGANPKEYKASWVSWEKFQGLREPIRRAVGNAWPTPPGTNFGPLEGDIVGPFTDFAWVWDWQCLVRGDVLERLNEALGSKLEATQTRIRTRRKEKPDYWEFVAWPTARLSGRTKSLAKHSHCSCCGTHYSLKDEPILAKLSSKPKDLHIFRILEWSHYVLCSEAFRRIVEDLKLRNISFIPVDVDIT